MNYFILSHKSILSLIYSFRQFDTVLQPVWNTFREKVNANTKKTSSFPYITPYIDLLHKYDCRDLQTIVTSINDKSIYKKEIARKLLYTNALHDMRDEIYSDNLVNISTTLSKQDISFDSELKLRDYFKDFNSNINKFKTNNITSIFNYHYNSIELDNTPIYNLRLVYIPRIYETIIHNHKGLCVYKLIDTHKDTSLTSLLSDTRYINPYESSNVSTQYYSNDRYNMVRYDYETTHNVLPNRLNFVYTNQYHQLQTFNHNCFSIHLYFHDYNLRKNNLRKN